MYCTLPALGLPYCLHPPPPASHTVLRLCRQGGRARHSVKGD